MKKSLALFCSVLLCASSSAVGFVYSRVDAKITNATKEVLDVYCQSSDPWYTCHHGEACIISSWPVIHLMPGETRQTPLWISNSDGSEVKLSFIQSNLQEYDNTSQYTLSRIESKLKDYGYVAIMMGSTISESHSQNLSASISAEYMSNTLTVKVSS